MASSRSSFGGNWPDQDAHVDTIDLTLSSPEPEPQLRYTPQRQYATSHFKREPRSESSNVKRVKTESNTPGRKSHDFQPPARPVNPAHLAAIVNTSDSQTIRSLLLELCKLSPALSGAVARGLAPHSSFAQGLIRQHRQPALEMNIARTAVGDEEQVYERTKQRLLAERRARGTSLRHVQSQSTSADTHGLKPSGSQALPMLKRERQPDFSDSDSDQDQYVPREFPIYSARAQPPQLPVRTSSGPGHTNRIHGLAPSIGRTLERSTGFSSSQANRTPKPISFAERLRNVQTKPLAKTESKTCIQCFKDVENEHETCFYHPHSSLNDVGVRICQECDEPITELGCAISMHVTES